MLQPGGSIAPGCWLWDSNPLQQQTDSRRQQGRVKLPTHAANAHIPAGQLCPALPAAPKHTHTHTWSLTVRAWC
jgi:hypothetical protein